MLTWLSKHLAYPLWDIKDGSRVRQHLSELNKSQWQHRDQLLAQQWKRARDIVKYAFDHCAYYRDCLADIASQGVVQDWKEFKRLPLLTKQEMRHNRERMISREFRLEDLVEARTGGSTGVALTVHFDERCQEMRNAAAMRSDQWAGWDLGMKVAAIWGNPPAADTLKKKIRNLLLDRTFYLDTMNINPRSVRDFVTQWRRTRPRMIFGHSHSIYILAMYLRQMGILDLRPRGIVATSMMLLAPERELIQRTFACQVTNRYGCEEAGLIACECEQHDGLHINVDHIVVEFLRDDGSEAAAGEDAQIVVTDVVNRGMPLIRYVIGDMGVASDRACACGRGLPLMERVTGRRADFLKRPDGSLVAGVSLVERTLTAVPGIEQMQLVQDELYRVRARIVASDDFTGESEQVLRSELQHVFGHEVTIDLERVSALDQTPTGKYRFAICNA